MASIEVFISTTGLYTIDSSPSNVAILFPFIPSTNAGDSYILKNLQSTLTATLPGGAYLDSISTPLFYKTPRLAGWYTMGMYPEGPVPGGDCLPYIRGGTIHNVLTTKYLDLTQEEIYVSSGFINASVNQVVVDLSQEYDGVSTVFLSAQFISTQVMSSIYITTVPSISTLQLSTGTATFSTIETTQGQITLSSQWLLYGGQGLQQFASVIVYRDSYRIESLEVSSATVLNTQIYDHPNVLSTLSIAFTQADQTVYPSSQTTFLPIDTSQYTGVLKLPDTSLVTGYFITVQDLANSFQTNPLTLSTTGADLFYPQLTTFCNVTSKTLTLVATADSLWRTIQNYQQSSFSTFQPFLEQTSSLVTSSLQTIQLYAPTMCQTQSFTFAP